MPVSRTRKPATPHMHCKACGKSRFGSLKFDYSRADLEDGEEATFTCLLGHTTLFLYQKRHDSFRMFDEVKDAA